MTSDRSPPVITITTDFGLADSYVAEMKGVILGICPAATIVDVSHQIRPQQVLQAVYLTQAAWPAFPSNSIHLAIVDPGVGGERRAVLLATPRGWYLGPDNGVLSSALPDDVRPRVEEGIAPVQPPDGYQAFAITNPALLREPISATFHGRDLFAPAAAHLAQGTPADQFGERLETMLAHPPLRARSRDGGIVDARVIHIDRFGNAVTDARERDLPNEPFVVEIASQTIAGPVATYEEADGLASIIGSSGYLEIALPLGDASAALGIAIGDPVTLRPSTGQS